MVVNGDARSLDQRGAFERIAGKSGRRIAAPTKANTESKLFSSSPITF
jgi:hypothetical protein